MSFSQKEGFPCETEKGSKQKSGQVPFLDTNTSTIPFLGEKARIFGNLGVLSKNA
ncbi:MAG: hypothetical protein HGB18_02270 [Candidatus Moranbacteria bacterium]|nr:hypothetical protein [Candidatus Moranbacteria bacterium]